MRHPTFLAVCGVYSGTYVAANLVQSECDERMIDPKYPKLGVTTVVNMTLGIMKDKYFAQFFSGKPATPFPRQSWALFVVRDTLTIGSGFTFPPMVAKVLKDRGTFESASTAATVAQLCTPMAMQLGLTPIHLLALDFYNNKVSTPSARVKSVLSNYPEATGIRFCRVLCAYGIAGITNIRLRLKLREMFLERRV